VVGIATGDAAPARPSIAGALGWGLLTAVATGPFAMLLLIIVMIAGDPSEILDDPLALLNALATLLTVGSIMATIFAVIIGWLPISLFGWALQTAGQRWPACRHAAVWAGVGAIAAGGLVALLGGTIDDVISDPDPANWERLRDMLVFGGGCGIFAGLFFRWLVARGMP
jgi:hypothetical protein